MALRYGERHIGANHDNNTREIRFSFAAELEMETRKFFRGHFQQQGCGSGLAARQGCCQRTERHVFGRSQGLSFVFLENVQPVRNMVWREIAVWREPEDQCASMRNRIVRGRRGGTVEPLQRHLEVGPFPRFQPAMRQSRPGERLKQPLAAGIFRLHAIARDQLQLRRRRIGNHVPQGCGHATSPRMPSYPSFSNRCASSGPPVATIRPLERTCTLSGWMWSSRRW